MEQPKRASKLAVACYGLGDFASQLVWTFVGSYLTVFYSDVVGLAPIVLSALMLGTRVLDAVIDPFIGAIAERTITKLGRFRPYILFGCPVLAVFSVLTFTAPFDGASPAAAVWATFTYGIAGIVYSFVNLPYGALSGAMTEDPDQRVQINSSRQIGLNVGMIVVNALTAVLTLHFSGAGAEVANGHGYFMASLIYAVLSIPLFCAVVFTSKEVVDVPENQASVKFSDTWKALVGNKYLMVTTIVIILMMTAFFGRIAVCAFYVIYCLGSFPLISVIMTIPSVATVLVSFAVPWMTEKLGIRNLLMASFFGSAAALLGVYLTPFDNLPVIIGFTVLYGLCSFGMPLQLGMIADSVDYMDHKAHVRTDGAAYGIFSLSTKIGNAVGASAGVLLLAAFGYVAGAQQTPEAMAGINLVVNVIPAILYVLGALACLFYKLSAPRMAKIRAELKERNEREAAEAEKGAAEAA